MKKDGKTKAGLDLAHQKKGNKESEEMKKKETKLEQEEKKRKNKLLWNRKEKNRKESKSNFFLETCP